MKIDKYRQRNIDTKIQIEKGKLKNVDREI